MSKQLRKDFQKFLEHGASCNPPGKAACALSNARTLQEWRDAESAGLVRLCVDDEQDNYFDVYGEPDNERERKAIEHQIHCHGCCVVFSEVNTGSEASGDKWEMVDSIGMCIYANPLDPFENCYVPDLMAAALKQIPQPGNVDELCSSL